MLASINHWYIGGGITMVQRLSKLEAARFLQVHHSTIDRMIQRGELQVEREGDGGKSKIWVLVDGPPDDTPNGSSTDSPSAHAGLASSSLPARAGQSGDVAGEVELATLRERVKNLEELVGSQRQQLIDADWRYQQLLEQLASSQRISENLSRPLPAGEPLQRRRWWPFGKA